MGGSQADGVFQTCQGFSGLALIFESESKIAMGLGVFRFKLQGLP